MRRRNFLKSATAAGTGLIFAPYNLSASHSLQNLSFLTEKGNPRMLFPRPSDGFELDITPPGLAWYPAPGAKGYRVLIRDKNGKTAYQKDIPAETVHLPDQILLH